MTSHILMLLLATGVFFNHTSSRSRNSLQEAAKKPDSKQDSRKDRPKTVRLPKWLKQLIHELEVGNNENPPERVIRYKYRKEFVYLIEAGCCDQFSRLYDTNHKLVCLTGGFTGGGDGKCPDFFTERKDKKIIWEQKRERR